MKKYHYEDPTFKHEGSPGVPLLNFAGGPWVPLLNFEGGVPGSWSHFYTMPKKKPFSHKSLFVFLNKYLQISNVVIRQKDQYQNAGRKKTKHATFSTKRTFFIL